MAIARFLGFMARHNFDWSRAGHIPAVRAVVESQRFRSLAHRADIAPLAATGVQLPPYVQRQSAIQGLIGDTTAAFFRSDEEHHSFACFRARVRKLDHFCFETNEWNDIRDWADHLATMHLPIGWGPGRHGPGNNLFFMLNDPDGNAFEFSAEIERIGHDVDTREWPHEQRTLNSWGSAWMRS